MSRSGYSENCDDQLALGRWRGQLLSAIRGKRGQAFLRELLDALETMPKKRLIKNALCKDGEVCALGALGAKRGIDLGVLDPENFEGLGPIFGVAYQLTCEIMYENDEVSGWNTPEERWNRLRDWVQERIKTECA